MSKDMRPLSSLHGWEQNPRAITAQAFERLKGQIKAHGQFKPVMITPDGTVIGGNMRLRAYKELDVSEVWVSIVNPETESEKVALALADNDSAGFYLETELQELAMSVPELDLCAYHVNLGKSISLEELINKVTPSADSPETEVGEAYANQAETIASALLQYLSGEIELEDVVKLTGLDDDSVDRFTAFRISNDTLESLE